MKKYLKKCKKFIFNKVFGNACILFLFLFIIEMIVRLVTKTFIGYGILRIAISSLVISLILSLITSYFKDSLRKLINIIFCTLITIYIFVEVGLYNYIGFYMGIGNSEQGAKNLDYIIDFLKSVKLSYYLILVPLIILIMYYIFIDKKITNIKGKKEKNVKKLIYSFISIICLSIIYYGTLVVPFMQNKLQTINNKILFIYPENSNLSVSQFGVVVYGVTDITSQLFNINIDDIEFTEIIDNKEDVITDYSRRIDDTNWNLLIENEKNTTYNKLNNYFINRNITEKNNYTGIFKDKNLIVILLESVNEIAINEKFFPNIYKIYNEGISFRNNYSPRNNCSTGNNETSVMTGLFSINNTCTANKYKHNVYPEAIFNVFKNSGYNVTSYHSYTDHYYSRHTIHKNMGSEKFYGVKDLGMEYSEVYEEWPSDLTFFETALPYFINENKFMAFMTTVTTHQTYNVPSEFGDKNLDIFESTEYSKTVKRYLSKMVELDKALGYLLEELERAGKLDDTVIALFADHYPYGLTNSQINTVLDYDVNNYQEVDRTPMVIYNSKTAPVSVEKYTSFIDLLPTLLNMFDLNYDPRYYMGTDIMSDYIGRVVYADGSWQDSVGFYRATNGKFTALNDENLIYTTDEIIDINKEVSSRQKMSALAIRNNYFKYLFDELEKYNEKENNEEIKSEHEEIKSE